MSSSTRPRTAESSEAASRRSVALLGLRGLMALVGVVGLVGTVYFSLIASPAEGGVDGAADWFVAAWSLSLAVGYLVAAVRLGDGARTSRRLALGLVLVHIVFNVVKLVGYDETEVVTFMAADLVILGLFLVSGRATTDRS